MSGTHFSLVSRDCCRDCCGDSGDCCGDSTLRVRVELRCIGGSLVSGISRHQVVSVTRAEPHRIVCKGGSPNSTGTECLV